jgi:hypothetical protein
MERYGQRSLTYCENSRREGQLQTAECAHPVCHCSHAAEEIISCFVLDISVQHIENPTCEANGSFIASTFSINRFGKIPFGFTPRIQIIKGPAISPIFTIAAKRAVGCAIDAISRQSKDAAFKRYVQVKVKVRSIKPRTLSEIQGKSKSTVDNFKVHEALKLPSKTQKQALRREAGPFPDFKFKVPLADNSSRIGQKAKH